MVWKIAKLNFKFNIYDYYLIVDCETNFKNWTKILIKAKYRKMIGIWIKISKKAHTKKA